jgi:hypothetical protein
MPHKDVAFRRAEDIVPYQEGAMRAARDCDLGSKDSDLRRTASGLLLIALSEVFTVVGVIAYAGLALSDLVRARDMNDSYWLVCTFLIAASLLEIVGKIFCRGWPAKSGLVPACLWASLGCNAACIALNLATEFTDLPAWAGALVLAVSIGGNLLFVVVLGSAAAKIKDPALHERVVEVGFFWIVVGALLLLMYGTGWDAKGIFVLIIGTLITYFRYFLLLLKVRRAALASMRPVRSRCRVT